MTPARIKAKNLIDQKGIDNPSILIEHLETLCFSLGASVKYGPLHGAEARIVASDGSAIITINESEDSRDRIRFSIGHELGHFLLHCNQASTFNCTKADMRNHHAKIKAINLEFEANDFAGELLIPEVLAQAVIKGRSPCIEAIDDLKNTFAMSFTVAAIRYAQLSTEPVAAVFYSKAKGIKFPTMSKYFQAQKYWFPQGTLDKESLAFDAVSGQLHPRMMSVAATAWLELPASLQEETIMEQTRYYPDYDWGFSLLWMKKGDLIRY